MAQTLLQYAAELGDPISAGVAMAVTNAGLFMRRLRFIPIGGMSFSYPELQKLGGIYYRGLNEDYPKGDYSIVNPVTERLPTFGGEVRTDNQFLGVHDGSMRTHEIQRRARKAALFYDRELLHGDPAANGGKGITGLRERIGGRQLLSAGTNGGPLTLDLLDELIDQVRGPNAEKVLVMNKAVRRSLKKVLVGSAGGTALVRLIEAGHQGTYWLDVLEVRAGFAVFNPRSAARLKGIKKPASRRERSKGRRRYTTRPARRGYAAGRQGRERT